MNEGTLSRLGRFVAEDPLELDAGALGSIRHAVIDCFGCILAGARHPVARDALAAVQAMGGSGDRPVYGTDVSVSKSSAASLNATAGHATEFDDWEAPGNTHPTVVLLPALLASAEQRTTGTELAQAYLAGLEVIVRLGEALNFEHYDRGWHSTATLGALGAAAAVSRLLGLNAKQTTGALSLAASRAGGLTCQFGSAAKALQAGFAAETGVIVAHMAQRGLAGQPDSMDHPRGLRALMAGTSENRMDAVMARLGNGYALNEHGIILKPWPSCSYTHRLMTAALELAPRVPDPSSVERIDLYMPDFHARILPFAQPSHRTEALFSVPFVVAMGLIKRGLTMADLDTAAWQGPDIRALIDRTEVHTFAPKRPELNYDPDEPDRIDLTLTGGEQLGATCSLPIGAHLNPMSAEQIEAKFFDNASGLSPSRAAPVFDWTSAKAVTDPFNRAGAQP